MLTPGPDHPIRLEPAQQRWRALFNGHVIADTADALVLSEATLPPVVYFPRDDVAMEYMAGTDRHTHCPYKGDASYFTLTMDGQVAENVAWSYEQPFDAMGPIGERIAFYADRVDIYAVDDAQVNPHHPDEARSFDRARIDEVIQHTDAGDGTSQREHWPPNVEGPDGGVR
jgi:uncharacterized protein (DUF427 family)